MIGSGILNQPYVFENAGIIGAFIGFIITCGMTWVINILIHNYLCFIFQNFIQVGLLILTEAGIYEGIYSYSELARRAFGNFGEIIIEWSIISGAIGAILGYILIIGETSTYLLRSWGCPNNICEKNMITSLSITIFVSPFCLFRHFGHFAGISIFSIITITLVLLLVIISGPLHQKKGKLYLFDLFGMFRSIGSIVFALNCSQANFQVYNANIKYFI